MTQPIGPINKYIYVKKKNVTFHQLITLTQQMVQLQMPK